MGAIMKTGSTLKPPMESIKMNSCWYVFRQQGSHVGCLKCAGHKDDNVCNNLPDCDGVHPETKEPWYGYWVKLTSTDAVIQEVSSIKQAYDEGFKAGYKAGVFDEKEKAIKINNGGFW